LRYMILVVLTAVAAFSQQDTELFETRIRPVLASRCYACHGPDQQASSLRLDSREAILLGGIRGPSIVAGQPGQSLLLKALRHEDLKMPMGGKLKDGEIAAFDEWIRKGAPWPASSAAASASGSDKYRQLVKNHWAFQPVKTPAVPASSVRRSPGNPIDAFISARLKTAGLSQAKQAGRRTLIRRLSYVLTGLPPTAEEVDSFAADNSPAAYVQLVDRFLASPRFGEQWARHWLDLVRYGETRGYEWNYEIIGAWRYRDYLIRAFNADVPYDQLVREHIAGDLLEKPRTSPAEQLNESIIGTAFYRLGEAGHDDCVMFRDIALDVVDNQIDTLTKTFQGLTVSCARCHNHKLDPIPTEDYYGLYGILNSSRVVTHTIDLPAITAKPISTLEEIKSKVHAEIAALWKRAAGSVALYMMETIRAAGSSGTESLEPARLQAWRKVLKQSAQKLENPAYPWASLVCATGSNEKFLELSAPGLLTRYTREAADRDAFNRDNFHPFADFRDGGTSGWYSSGLGLPGARDGSLFTVAETGDSAIASILPGGLYTHTISSRLNGALRSPDLPKNKKRISVRLMGGSLGARRTVIDNCAIGEAYKVLENDTPAWVKLDTFAAQERLPVFIELVTRSDNPRLPDRPGVLKPYQAKLLESPRSYFGITQAVLHDIDETPREELSHMLPLFHGGAPRSWTELAQRYQEIIGRAVENWSIGKATDDDVRWLQWMLRSDLLPNGAGLTPNLRSLISEYRAIESKIAEPRVVEGLADAGPGHDYPVLIGGDSKNPAKPAPRRFLQSILNDAPFEARSSGRAELAAKIASPQNPLTARVMVNRIWHHVFGRGIVATVDNFGVIGDKPSHPELLDYLASQFIENGWSVKRLIRLMVLSETFRQTSSIDPGSAEADPQNALLHHYPVRRLTAESIRDSILLAAGTLDTTMFGRSIEPHRDQAKEYRRLFSGPVDGGGRRSIYTKVTRMEGPAFLETFDYPNPMAARGSRDVTNVPAQALALLNDPFVIAEASECADRLLATPGTSVDERIEELFRRALARMPTAVERERFAGMAAELASLYRVPRDRISDSREVWKDLAHAVFNMKEFIYIQ
jgi:hypothetical protein